MLGFFYVKIERRVDLVFLPNHLRFLPPEGETVESHSLHAHDGRYAPRSVIVATFNFEQVFPRAVFFSRLRDPL